MMNKLHANLNEFLKLAKKRGLGALLNISIFSIKPKAYTLKTQ